MLCLTNVEVTDVNVASVDDVVDVAVIIHVTMSACVVVVCAARIVAALIALDWLPTFMPLRPRLILVLLLLLVLLVANATVVSTLLVCVVSAVLVFGTVAVVGW